MKKKKRSVETLDSLSPGDGARIDRLTSKCSMKGRLEGLGFCPGAEIRCVMRSPLGDPTAYLIRGTLIALRRSDARFVAIER